MKIGIISNLYEHLPKIDECEVLFIVGNVFPKQTNFNLIEEWITNIFIKWANKLPCNHVILTSGDHYLKSLRENDLKIYELFVKPTKGKIEILYNTECNIISEDGNVYKIFGNIDYKVFINDEKYSIIPKWCDIIVSNDFSLYNKTLIAAIKEKNPRLILNSESSNKTLNNHSSKFINATDIISYLEI